MVLGWPRRCCVAACRGRSGSRAPPPRRARLRDWGDDLGWAGAVRLAAAVRGCSNFVVPWPILAGATGARVRHRGRHAARPRGRPAGVERSSSGWRATSRRASTCARSVLARVPRLDALLAARTASSPSSTAASSRCVPWGVVNYAAGLARVRLRDLLLATLAGGHAEGVRLRGARRQLRRPLAAGGAGRDRRCSWRSR